MPKKGVSVTLHDDNLLWLKGRTIASKGRSLSDTLDSLVTAARTGGDPIAVRSVVGTLDIAEDDPGLEKADAYIGTLVDDSVRRPVLVRDATRPYRAAPPRKRRG